VGREIKGFAMKKWRLFRLLLPLFMPIMLMLPGIWGLKIVLVRYFNFQEESIAYLVACLLSTILTVLVELAYIQSQEKRRQKAVRGAVQFLRARGVKIVSRVHPVTYIDTEPRYYEEAAESSYTLSYRFPQASTWSLHKTRSGQGNLANGWKLIVNEGEISSSTKAFIETIANDKTWLETSLELGSDRENVWAFWNDGYDDLSVAQKVFDVLTQIIEISKH
jgi:hypothetical protein